MSSSVMPPSCRSCAVDRLGPDSAQSPRLNLDDGLHVLAAYLRTARGRTLPRRRLGHAAIAADLRHP